VTTAICLTPDRRFFGPAVCVASQVIAAGVPADTEIVIVCEEDDVWPGFDRLDAVLRAAITLHTTKFGPLVNHAPATPQGSRAIYRRLVLDRVLPEKYQRFIAIDSDIAVTREGLAPLVALDLGGNPIAAAVDMIFYMDFGGPLAEEFRAHRLSLGLAGEAPYFNNGVTVIDRAKWESEELGLRALALIAGDPQRYTWFDQDALNVLLAGRFAPLSPRWNFMGDFLLLDLERDIAPAVYHFVNRPKPWEQGYPGDPRFAAIFYRWFTNSPWPDFAAPPASGWNPPPVSRFFRRNLLAYLEKQNFADNLVLTIS
jgi:lipopolysaccharide biosynthesis glycosyltransferase